MNLHIEQMPLTEPKGSTPPIPAQHKINVRAMVDAVRLLSRAVARFATRPRKAFDPTDSNRIRRSERLGRQW
jgi:hypothetical protein